MYCTDLSLVQHEAGSLIAAPLYCRAWTCPICAPRRAAELRWLARSGEPESFLTLTVNPARYASPQERARALSDAWRWLRRRLRARWPGHAFDFIAVFERTKRGEPHLHVLFRGPYVPQAWISERMAARIGAPIVDIRRARNQAQAAAYVTKYVAKDPTRWDGCKRYWRSQGWQLWARLVSTSRAGVTYIIDAAIADVRRDQATTGVTVARQIRGPPLALGWWTGQVRELHL